MKHSALEFFSVITVRGDESAAQAVAWCNSPRESRSSFAHCVPGWLRPVLPRPSDRLVHHACPFFYRVVTCSIYFRPSHARSGLRLGKATPAPSGSGRSGFGPPHRYLGASGEGRRNFITNGAIASIWHLARHTAVGLRYDTDASFHEVTEFRLSPVHHTISILASYQARPLQLTEYGFALFCTLKPLYAAESG